MVLNSPADLYITLHAMWRVVHYYLKKGQLMEDDNSHGLMTHILTIDASQHHAKSTVSAHMCLVHAQYGNEWKTHAYTLGSCLHKRLLLCRERHYTVN